MRETEGFRPQLFILHYSSFIIHYWVYRPDKPKFEPKKGDRAVQYAVIRNGHGIVTALLDTGREVGYTARAVQKTVFGVEVKMDEGAHGRSPF